MKTENTVEPWMASALQNVPGGKKDSGAAFVSSCVMGLERGRRILGCLSGIMLGVAALLCWSRATVRAAEGLTAPVRLFIVVDDSGSMRRARRLDHALLALRRWLGSLDRRDGATIELATASDHVTPVGTYELADEASVPGLLEALGGLKPKRLSRTVFRTIDAETAEWIVAKTRADEQVAVALVTDGISDEPASDLALLDLGERIVPFRPGLFAVVTGTFPHVNALVGAESASGAAPQAATRHQRGRVRRLLPSTLGFAPSASVLGGLRARLMGGYDPARFEVEVRNPGPIPREVQLRASGPRSSSAFVDPQVLVIAGRGSARATVTVQADASLAGTVLVTAEAPDGALVQHAVRVELVAASWASSNAVVLACGAGVVAVVLVLVWLLGRRPLVLAPAGQTEPSAELRPGDAVPVSTFVPECPGGVIVGRGRLGLYIKTAGSPVAVNGVPVRPNTRARYRLRAPIEAGQCTVTLDRVRDDALAGQRAFTPTSTGEGLL